MAEDEIYNVILRVQGESDVIALTAKLRQEEQTLATVVAGLGNLTKAQLKANAEVQTSVGAIQQYTNQLRIAQEQAVQLGSTTGGSAGKAGQALSQLGYAADDLQYGFRGIANNIQPILSSIPALSGVAGPISIAAIAAYQLYTHWDQVAAAFGDVKPITDARAAIDDVAKSVKAAREALAPGWLSNTTGADVAVVQRQERDLAERQAAAKGFEDLAGDVSPEEAKARKRFKEAMTEAGGARELAKQLAAREAAENPDYAKKYLSDAEAEIYEGNKRAIAGAKRAGVPTPQAVADTQRGLEMLGFEGLVRSKQEEIGAALTDPTKRQAFVSGLAGGGMVGKAGDLLSGRKATESERKAAQEAEEKDLKGVAEFHKNQAAQNRRIDKGFEDDARKVEENRRRKEAENARGVKEVEDYERDAAKEALHDVRKNSPGIDKILESVAGGALEAGASPEAARAMLRDKLKGAVDDETAAALAEEAVTKGGGRLMRDELKDTRSATFGGAEFARAIQAGVGGDPHLNEQKKSNELLAVATAELKKIAAKPGGDGKVRPGA